MDIKEAIKKIESLVSQRKAAEACHYSSAHFGCLVRSVRRGEAIPAKAEMLITAYAEKLA